MSDPRGIKRALCQLESEFKRLLCGSETAPRLKGAWLGLAFRCLLLPPTGGSGTRPSPPGLQAGST